MSFYITTIGCVWDLQIFKLLGGKCSVSWAKQPNRGEVMNDTRGKTKEKKNWLTVRDFLAFQSVFINTETAPLSVCEGRKSGKCWTSSSLQTTDQSLHLKLSISIYLGLPSNWIKGMGSLHQCYTINWYHLAQKEGQNEEEEATVTNHCKILWTHSYTIVPFLT